MTRMTGRAVQILLALVEGPLHGYGIKSSVEARTDGAIRLGSGTLYAAIDRLVAQRLIEEVAGPIEARSGGPDRRYYALTIEGRNVLTEELRRMERTIAYARAQKLLGESPS